MSPFLLPHTQYLPWSSSRKSGYRPANTFISQQAGSSPLQFCDVTPQTRIQVSLNVGRCRAQVFGHGLERVALDEVVADEVANRAPGAIAVCMPAEWLDCIAKSAARAWPRGDRSLNMLLVVERGGMRGGMLWRKRKVGRCNARGVVGCSYIQRGQEPQGLCKCWLCSCLQRTTYLPT